MLGPTHYAAGGIAGVLALEYLNSKGMLIPEVPFLVQCLLTYPMASYASVLPDFDQSEDSMPIKSPVAKFIHFVIYKVGGSHRSWHTHGFDFIGCLCFMLIMLATYGPTLSIGFMQGVGGTLGFAIVRLLIVGFSFGLLSHIILDSFTRAGTPSLLFPKFRLRFVPNNPIFSTGSTYEMIVRKILTLIFWLMIFYKVYLMLKGVM